MSKCLLARAKLAQFVDGLKPSSAAAKAGTLIKAGYLASLKGLERNVLSNFMFGVAIEDLAVQPIAQAFDVIQAYSRSALTFGRVAPHELRTFASSHDIGGLNAARKGVREGTAQAVQLLRYGVDADVIGGKFDLQQTNFENPVVRAVTHGIFNGLEASDKPFFGYAYQRGLYQRAKLLGIRAGYTGAKLTAEIDRWLASPTEGMMLGALEDAQYATFKNRTALGEAAAGMRSRIAQRAETETPGHRLGYQAAGLALDTALPFTRVGSAVVGATADLTPGVAVARAIFAEAFDKNPNAHGAFVKAAARTTVGAALVFAGGRLMQQGKISLDADTPNERAEMEATGRTPYSVKINGRWRSILWLGPGAPSLLLGAYLEDVRQRKAAGGFSVGYPEQALAGAAFMAKTLSEASYLQSVRSLIEATEQGERAARKIATALTPTPTIVGQIRTAADPLKRDVAGVADQLRNATPGLSRTLPAKRDVTGAEVPRRAPGVRGVVESFLDPSNPSTDRSTPALRELDRLGLAIGKPAASYHVGGEKVSRTPADRSAILAEFGPQLLAALETTVAAPSYATMTDTNRAALLRRVIAAHRREAMAIDRGRHAVR